MNHSNAPTASALEPMLRKLEYRGRFDDSDRAALLALPHSVRTVEPHHYIVRERELATHCAVILSGFAIRQKIVAGGARQILSVHMKGEMVDLQNSLLRVADHSVQTLTRSKVAVIPVQAIKQLALDRPNIGMAMWYDTLVDGSVYREWIANVGRRDARARIAHILCEIALRLKVAGLGEPNHYELPMTQEQLADATGLTPVHVNRTLKALDADSLISRASSRTITIADWSKLAYVGDFDSTYLHLREDEPALT